MKIAIGSDALGFELKEVIKEHLVQTGHEVHDVGTTSPTVPVDFITTADNVAGLIQAGQCDRGMLMCNTGMGVSLVANKHKGIYCALCESVWTAQRSRQINDANILAMGAGVVGAKMAIDMADIFIHTPFASNEPDDRRELLRSYIDLVAVLEDKQFT